MQVQAASCTPSSLTPEPRFLFDAAYSSTSPHVTGIPNSGAASSAAWAAEQALPFPSTPLSGTQPVLTPPACLPTLHACSGQVRAGAAGADSHDTHRASYRAGTQSGAAGGAASQGSACGRHRIVRSCRRELPFHSRPERTLYNSKLFPSIQYSQNTLDTLNAPLKECNAVGLVMMQTTQFIRQAAPPLLFGPARQPLLQSCQPGCKPAGHPSLAALAASSGGCGYAAHQPRRSGLLQPETKQRGEKRGSGGMSQQPGPFSDAVCARTRCPPAAHRKIKNHCFVDRGLEEALLGVAKPFDDLALLRHSGCRPS